MTELRDARFKKALETAPDADARPAPAVSQAIMAAARRALPAPPAPAKSQAWWQRLWQRTGSPRAPWGAAFASLLLAVLVTVMWVHEPIPDARPIAPSAPPLASPAKPQAPEAPATAPTPAPAPGPAPAPLRKAAPAPAPAAVTQSAAEPPAAPATPPAPATVAPAGSAGDRMASGAASPAPSPLMKDTSPGQVPSPMAEAAPSPGPRERQERADAAAESARTKSLATPAPMPRAAATASNLSAAPQSAGNADAAAREVKGWTRVEISIEAHSGSANQPAAQELINRVQALLRQGAPEPAVALPDSEPLLRLGIRSQSAPLASLSLWATVLRWQREGQPEVRRAVQADEVQALLQLARQALAQQAAPPN
ncbi:MAG: hypothetical protein HXX19_15950 [Rhodoferax sp.]|nr:hypothetical protein [Rhodoferax sp.]